MPSPFPGMNPYLEHRAFWSSFHTRLMVAIADTVAPQLRPNYYIEVETRTYQDQEEPEEILVGIPDAAVLAAQSTDRVEPLRVESGATLTQKRPRSILLPQPTTLKERYLEVREVGTDTFITVIEVLSPKNKQKGKGRTAYENKRRRILGSLSNLVEIDLIRAGIPMTIIGKVQPSDYRLIVSRSSQRPQADLYDFDLREPIPSVPLPLRPEDEEPLIELQAIVQGVCDRAGYNERIDYSQPVPPPKLSNTTQQWLDKLIASFRSA
ncbi:DUF4058 family protein [Desertifilum sp. FACHB-1129]|uniref:DUF4058 family protein n=1 Tax=unclassified Desertifilum TaxID=2621682 RepID=UPI0016839819|nr:MULTISPECIES: DUF4058 family protein [unclassified Desertifilum]MBD2311244.1 DUF4058 family protein [Desertifilum sp. FACHB-1129]MBD2324311.1 DUF4058 family protein [Desertifilum sp. FACHB-866]MBD2334325.1 DUF4058 family protein [Desertifilum sp. FACHB-868]MDA0213171.1 DUF4058 family protein [Cyanobacteria bacterium FC1]